MSKGEAGLATDNEVVRGLINDLGRKRFSREALRCSLLALAASQSCAILFQVFLHRFTHDGIPDNVSDVLLTL